MNKLDILAFAAHPDDTELSCAGTLALQVNKGNRVGVIDLTRGELGTRGTPEIREKEAADSAKVLGLAVRENLMLQDGFFTNSRENQMRLIQSLRTYKPDIVLLNAPSDRHPDHGRSAQLELDACFLSGLAKIETKDANGKQQEEWRPKAIYHYIQSNYLQPDFIVDISATWEVKQKSIECFSSQFFNPNVESNEPETFISKPGFMKFIEARAIEFGHSIGAEYGEGFIKIRNIGVSDLSDLI